MARWGAVACRRGDCEQVLAAFTKAGIDLNALAAKLQSGWGGVVCQELGEPDRGLGAKVGGSRFRCNASGLAAERMTLAEASLTGRSQRGRPRSTHEVERITPARAVCRMRGVGSD